MLSKIKNILQKPQEPILAANVVTLTDEDLIGNPIKVCRVIRTATVNVSIPAQDLLNEIRFKGYPATYEVIVLPYSDLGNAGADFYDIILAAEGLSLCPPELAPFLLIKARNVFESIADRLGSRFAIAMKPVGDSIFALIDGNGYPELELYDVGNSDCEAHVDFWVFVKKIS